MKRILIATGIYAPDIGGPASYARNISARLAAQDVDVTILTYSSVMSFKEDANMPFHIVRVWKKIPWGIRHIYFFIRAFFLARSVDGVLSLNATTSGFTVAVATRLARRPFAVKIIGDYAWEIAVQTGKTFTLINDFQKSQKSGRIKRLDRMQRWVCRQAKAVIVPSEYLAGLVVGWGIPREEIHVIYNGIELPKIDISKEDARRQIGISGNIIISCGRLVPWKGFRMLIKIMQQLLQVNQFFRLIIVGDGPDMPMLQSVV